MKILVGKYLLIGIILLLCTAQISHAKSSLNFMKTMDNSKLMDDLETDHAISTKSLYPSPRPNDLDLTALLNFLIRCPGIGPNIVRTVSLAQVHFMALNEFTNGMLLMVMNSVLPCTVDIQTGIQCKGISKGNKTYVAVRGLYKTMPNKFFLLSLKGLIPIAAESLMHAVVKSNRSKSKGSN